MPENAGKLRKYQIIRHFNKSIKYGTDLKELVWSTESKTTKVHSKEGTQQNAARKRKQLVQTEKHNYLCHNICRHYISREIN